MKNAVLRELLAMAKWLTGLAILAIVFNACAGEGGEAAVPKGMQRYIIPMKGCAVEFVAKAGGYTEVIESGPAAAGSFRHISYYSTGRDVRSMSFSIDCHPGNAEKLCPDEIKKHRGTDPVTIRDTQQRDLKDLNPWYYTDAVIETATAIAPPRRREMHLCLGDQNRTIATLGGGIRLGFDPRETVATRGEPVLAQSEKALPDVLAIIRSMHFVPDPLDGHIK